MIKVKIIALENIILIHILPNKNQNQSIIFHDIFTYKILNNMSTFNDQNFI